MSSACAAGQQQPRYTDLQQSLSNTLHQTAGNDSTSAYAAPAVADKVHSDSTDTTAPPDNMSAVMSDTACDLPDSLNTEPVPDASAHVLSPKDEHAALTVSIPGQVDTQEQRFDSYQHLPAVIAIPGVFYLAVLQQILHHNMHKCLIRLSYASLTCSPVLASCSLLTFCTASIGE